MTPSGVDAHRHELMVAWVESLQQFYRSAESQVFRPLAKAVEQAAERHEALSRELGLLVEGEEQADSPTAAEEAWEKIRRYRRDVHEQVLGSLQEALDQLQLGESIEALDLRWGVACAAAVQKLPQTVTDEEDRTLYHVDDDDGLARIVGKLGVRSQRAVAGLPRSVANVLRTVVRKERRPGPVQVRSVPMRAIAVRHLNLRVQPTRQALADEVAEVAARIVSDLELALTRWTSGILEVEGRLDVVEAHFPGAARQVDPEAMDGAASGSEPPEREKNGDARTPTAASFTDVWPDARVVSRELQSALREHIGPRLVPPDSSVLAERLASVEPPFAEDLRQGGTFLLPARRMEQVSKRGRTGRKADARRVAWPAWHRVARNRISLDDRRLLFREELVVAQTRLIEEVEKQVSAFRGAIETVSEDLATLAKEAAGCFERADPTPHHHDIEDFLDRGRACLEERLLPAVNEIASGKAIRGMATEAADGMLDRLNKFPRSVEVHLLPQQVGDLPNPEAETILVQPHAAAQQAFDALVIEGLGTSSDQLLTTLSGLAEEASQVLPSFVFNLETALALQNGDETVEGVGPSIQEGEVGLDEAETPALLTQQAIQRSIDMLQDLVPDLDPAFEDFVENTLEAFLVGWQRIHARLKAQTRTKDQLLGLTARLATRRTALSRWVGAWVQRFRFLLRRNGRWLRMRSARWIRIGRSAVGAPAVSEQESDETIIALGALSQALDELPLVYRRLFSLDPLIDEGLLIGREQDLGWVEKRFELWSLGMTTPVLLVGGAGGGMSSTLNMVPRRLGVSEVGRWRLDARVRSEAQLVAGLATALGLPAAESMTLDTLIEQVDSAPPSEPKIAIVEGLAHLMLRAPGGTRWAIEALAFFTSTNHRVFWVLSMADHAWGFLEKAEKEAAALVTARALASLDRIQIEEVIMWRHQRSGLPLQFQMPVDLGAVQLRRFGKLRADEDRQLLLRQDYFDRLYRQSTDSVGIALYTWIRSVDFEVVPGMATVRPLKPLHFGYLRALSLDQAFALKAFLEHDTLTVAEHAEIFRVGVPETVQLLGSLADRVLIVPVVKGAPHPNVCPHPGVIRPDVQYRIRPMLTTAVVEHLRRVNLVY